MKKQIIPILLVTMSLSGCSGFVQTNDELVSDAEIYTDVSDLKALPENQKGRVLDSFNKKYSKAEVETADVDMNIDADMNVSQDGLSLNMGMNLTDNIQYNAKDDIYYQNINGNVDMSIMNIDLNMESYTVKEGKDYYTYLKTSALGETTDWKKTKTDTEVALDKIVLSSIDKDKVKNVYQNEKTKDYVFELDADLFKGVTDSINSSVADEQDLSLDLSDATAYISTDQYMSISGYYLNLAGVSMSDDADITFDKFDITLDFNSMNEDVDLKLPSEAKNAVLEDEEETALSDEIHVVSNQIEETEEDIEETEVPITTKTSTSVSTGAVMKINNKELSFPCSVQDLLALGFTLEENPTIEAGDYKIITLDGTKDDSIILTVENDTKNTITASEGTVTALSYDGYLSKDVIDFEVFGVGLNTSKEDTTKLFGEPTCTYTGSNDYSSNTYEYNNYELDFKYTDDLTTGVRISK